MRIHQIIDDLRQSENDQAFLDLNPDDISALSDKDLALWQRHQDVDSAQFILACHEWNRRLLERQLRSGRFFAWLGVLGTLAGSLGGVYLGYLLTSSP
ncbi:MAG: hypothetical protein H7A51_13630 [Akkermansiaceae bacterium]|nr:hypothetical protein [Akkermansiaceae bacterium]